MDAPLQFGRSSEELFTAYAASGDDRVRTQIIEQHKSLVRSLARKYVRPGVSVEDLAQSAWIGLIGAVDRFDPTHHNRFTTYAIQCAVGEIKRYFRDKTWALKVPRQLQELSALLPSTQERLCASLQRMPAVAEMAEALQVSEEELLRAMDLGYAYAPCGLEDRNTSAEGLETRSISDTIGARDERLETIAERSDLRTAVQRLDERERRIIHLRYSLGATQLDVAHELGISQMHVSRLERKALVRLRSVMVSG